MDFSACRALFNEFYEFLETKQSAELGKAASVAGSLQDTDLLDENVRMLL